MPILLGALSAIFIGISDTFGRASARRADAVSHVSTQMFVGFFVALVMTQIVDSTFLVPDLVSGAISGVFVGVGLSIVYKAMAESSSAVTAPVAGVVVALLPLGWDVLFGGARLGALAGVGCAVAIGSLVLVTYNPRLGKGVVRSGLLLALTGGVFFGLAVIFAGDTSAESGVWPAVSQRALAFLAMVVIARRRSIPIFLPKRVMTLGVFGGITGAFGMAALIVGSQQGDLGTVSVVGATYPAVIVVLSTLFDDDEMRWWQGVGVAGAIAGTALIALG